MLCTALSVPGLGPPDIELVGSTLPQWWLLLADASETQAPIALLVNIFPGHVELCVGLAGPHSDFVEL